MDKSVLRKEMLNRRKQMSDQDMIRKSAAIKEKLVSLPEYKACSKLFCYVSANNEVDTFGLIKKAWFDNKRVFVPRVTPKTLNMHFYEIDSFDGLVKSKFGILEPEVSQLEAMLPDNDSIIVVPGVAFDLRGNRIGYGAGYYDNYLNGKTFVKTVALCYDFQLLEFIEPAAHDIQIDTVIFG